MPITASVYLTVLSIAAPQDLDPKFLIHDTPVTWVISGQSNACGRGLLPGPESSPRVTAWQPKTREWIVARDPLPGIGTSGVGPWVAAATEVVSKVEDLSVHMTLTGLGGHGIGFWAEDQFLGKGLIERIRETAVGAQVFLWYQGESDAGREIDDYQGLLKDLVRRVREAAENPEMIVVVVQLASHTGADLTSIREAQRRFVVEDEHALLVPALGRTMKDAAHLDTAGYRELGREIACALLTRRHGLDDLGWPGPVMDRAVRFGDGVTVHFAEVSTLQGSQSADFRILHEGREIPCTAGGATMARVHLRFEEPVPLGARLCYGGRPAPGSALRDERGFRAPAVILTIEDGPRPGTRPTRAPNGAGS